MGGTMAHYFLPAHVHFCARGDAFVFLDLRKDDYTLIDGRSADAIRVLCAGGRPRGTDALNEALNELLSAGLLTADPMKGRSVAPTLVELADELLVDPESPPKPRITLHHFWHFVCACTLATIRLRRDPIEALIRKVEARKARLRSSSTADFSRARQLTVVFQTLRSFFPRDYLCLFDSLALVEFLARYELFPTWVFAITLEPWGAHCWVQEGRFIFNEGVEEAARYSPVMAI
jgi:hypothetical protein